MNNSEQYHLVKASPTEFITNKLVTNTVGLADIAKTPVLLLLSLELLALLAFILLTALSATADYVGLEVQTQVNQRTDLFNKSIDNLPQLEKDLEDQKQANINSMGDGRTSMPEGLSFITKQSKSELESDSARLNGIHENDLNSRGRDEIIKNNAINELYPDYSLPLNRKHMEEAKSIAEGQNKLLDNLFAVLKKEAGIDCRTVKGDKKHEPEYFLEVKTTTHKDTVYTQTLCEELRNQYNCRDEVTLTCKKKGIAWGDWQDKEIHVPGKELFDFGKPVFCIERTAPRCFEYKLIVERKKLLYKKFFSDSTPDPDQLIPWMREFLATKHPGGTKENISDEMSSSWHGWIFSINGWNYCGRTLGYKDHLWSTYVIKYKYRDGKPVCLEWSEDWSEACKLQ